MPRRSCNVIPHGSNWWSPRQTAHSGATPETRLLAGMDHVCSFDFEALCPLAHAITEVNLQNTLGLGHWCQARYGSLSVVTLLALFPGQEGECLYPHLLRSFPEMG